MKLEEMIQQAWADHEKKTAEVADRLEAGVDLVESPDDAVQLMNLAIHAIGDHVGDRARARRVCEAAMARLGDDPGPAPHLYLAVARRLDGDEPGAAEAQAALGEDPAGGVRVDMLVAQGLMHAGDWGAAGATYDRALEAAESLPAGHAGERATAIVSNNLASELLRKADRSSDDDARMVRAALGAKTFWCRVGTWENDERGDYLLALVHHALGRHDEARGFAERGLSTIAENGEEKVDEAFLHLARARACRDLGNADEHKASLERAEDLASEFNDDGLMQWFAGELEKSR